MGSISLGDKKVEVKDGGEITEACESFGIPFSCKEGVCGSCLIDVVDGKDNLSDLNEKEEAFGLDDKSRRLACQCKMKSGDVKIQSGY